MNKITKALAALGLVGTLAGCASNQVKPVAQAQQPFADVTLSSPQTEYVYTGGIPIGEITTFSDGCKDIAYYVNSPRIKKLVTHIFNTFLNAFKLLFCNTLIWLTGLFKILLISLLSFSSINFKIIIS